MHIMLDLETLDTANTAVVLSIGAVAFDPRRPGPVESFYVEMSPDIDDQQTHGRTISGSTVLWWMQQSDAARQLFDTIRQVGIRRARTVDALHLFGKFLTQHDSPPIWGNGADFDNAILASLYKSYSIEQPWSHRQNRCYRTVKALHPGIALSRSGTHHNALDDAATQARHLQEIYACLPSR